VVTSVSHTSDARYRARSISTAICALMFLSSALSAGTSAYAQTAEPTPQPSPEYAPLALDNPFGTTSLLPSAYAPPASDSGSLSYFKKVDSDDLQVSSFVASRAAQDAANYRLYLGLGYKHELTSFARIAGRTFYGAGTYDGVNPESGALPDEVRSSGNPTGAWLGSNWQVESKLFDRHTFYAGVEYRQQLAMPLMEISEFLARNDAIRGSGELARTTGFVTRSRFALTSQLALNIRTRFDEASTATGITAPGLNAVGTNSFEVGMERSGTDGQRTQLSYTWQGSTDDPAATGSMRNAQHLTKLRMDIPALTPRITTGFELQYLDVGGPFDGGQDRDYIIGNFTLAGHDVGNRTRVSIGLNNLFGARETVSGTRLLSFIPPDGRSVRLDLVRKL
jgi:hypothetical protein